MIAYARTCPSPHFAKSPSEPGWHVEFLHMLPSIELHARIAFRHLKGDDRDDAIQETIANTLAAYVRLVEQGRPRVASAASLARYAVLQVRAGRRVGTRLNVRDTLSWYARRRKHLLVERLDRYDFHEGSWQEVLVEDRTVTPADLAVSRLDYAAWLKTLSDRNRKLAETLASGESTTQAARLFGVSKGRISQLRRQLKAAWQQFHALPIGTPPAVTKASL